MSENNFNIDIVGMMEAARRMEERGESPRSGGTVGIKATDEFAGKVLAVALENGKFDRYIFSFPLYDLRLPDGYGGDVHSARHVMEAIYTKQREDGACDFAQMITDTVTSMLTNYRFHPCIPNLLENLEYHMHSEKTGRAAFTLDMDKIFDVIRTHLLENQEVYKKPSMTYGKYGMWPRFEMWDARLKGSFGKGIL